MKYLSLLRGINVGGKNIIRMADLKTLYEQLGFADVVTYIQSGNVVFATSRRSAKSLKTRIEAAITAKYGFQVPVELRTKTELDAVIAGNPFGKIDLVTEGTKVSVTFLSAVPAAERCAAIAKFVSAPDELVIRGREVYLRCPDGYGKTKLGNTFLERQLEVAATTRNWKTVHKLLHLLAKD